VRPCRRPRITPGRGSLGLERRTRHSATAVVLGAGSGRAHLLPRELHRSELARDSPGVRVSLSQPATVRAAQVVFGGRRSNAEHLVCVGGDRTVLHPVENTGWRL